MPLYRPASTQFPCTVQIDNALKVRASATVGEEAEAEVTPV